MAFLGTLMGLGLERTPLGTICSILAFFAPFLQAQSRGRGLLPDPTLLQILSALRSPTAAPLLHGALGGKRGKEGGPIVPEGLMG